MVLVYVTWSKRALLIAKQDFWDNLCGLSQCNKWDKVFKNGPSEAIQAF